MAGKNEIWSCGVTTNVIGHHPWSWGHGISLAVPTHPKKVIKFGIQTRKMQCTDV